MNIPIDGRLQAAIQRIERRANPEPVNANPGPVRRLKIPTIPKTPAHYDHMVAQARRHNDPYLVSVFLRAAKLSRAGKHADIVKLLRTANTMLLRRNPVAPRPAAPRPARRRNYNLRSAPGPHRQLNNNKTLKDFIVDYTEKIKHKKQMLHKFLVDMYVQNKRYRTATKKFAKAA